MDALLSLSTFATESTRIASLVSGLPATRRARRRRLLAGVLDKAPFWQRWASTPMNERQTRVLNRVLDGMDGRLTNARWAALAQCSPDTALRDINALLALGELGELGEWEGAGRNTAHALRCAAA